MPAQRAKVVNRDGWWWRTDASAACFERLDGYILREARGLKNRLVIFKQSFYMHTDSLAYIALDLFLGRSRSDAAGKNGRICREVAGSSAPGPRRSLEKDPVIAPVLRPASLQLSLP